MGQNEIICATATELASLIRSREITAIGVCDAFCAHIADTNSHLNALIRFDPATGHAAAKEAEQRLARGDSAPLLGVPFTVKDNIWVAGQTVSQGSALFENFVAPTDAVAVARLRAAGGVLIGITNCSEFACKGVTTNPLYGPTRNPWDLSRTPGGSSGGAAAAVAAGLCPIGLTTDGGGSTRRPAAHTGIVGMKPTTGLIPHPLGFAEPVFGNSAIGQMARSVKDVALMLDVMSGPDPRDPLAHSDRLPYSFIAEIENPRSNFKVGYSRRLGLGFPVEPDVAECVESTLRALESAGIKVEEADPTWTEGAGEEGLMPLQLAGLAALYGEQYMKKTWRVDPDIAKQIEAGLDLSGGKVAQALLLREQMYKDLAHYFARYDLLVTPTTPVVAWPLDQLGPVEIEGRTVSPRGHAVFTPIFNHCFVPACSMPCGLDRQGLPVGLQIVGARFADLKVLQLARGVEAVVPQDFKSPRRVGGIAAQARL